MAELHVHIGQKIEIGDDEKSEFVRELVAAANFALELVELERKQKQSLQKRNRLLIYALAFLAGGRLVEIASLLWPS